MRLFSYDREIVKDLLKDRVDYQIKALKAMFPN